MTIDPERRAMLIAKYGIDRRPMEPALNTTVQVIDRAKQLETRAFARGTDYNQWLFDPARSPRLHKIAADAHRDLRLAIAHGDIEGDDPNDDRVLVHFVGAREVHAVDRGRSADRFAASLRRHDATQPYCDEYRGNI